MDNNQIEQKAKEILDTYWDGMLPVKILGLIQTLGFEVYQKELNNNTVIINNKKIIINKNLDTKIRRFALANALGHIIVNKVTNLELSRSDYMTNSTEENQKANYFAQNILIPGNVLNFAINNQKISTIQGLSDAFGVSEVLVKNQAKSKKII